MKYSLIWLAELTISPLFFVINWWADWITCFELHTVFPYWIINSFMCKYNLSLYKKILILDPVGTVYSHILECMVTSILIGLFMQPYYTLILRCHSWRSSLAFLLQALKLSVVRSMQQRVRTFPAIHAASSSVNMTEKRMMWAWLPFFDMHD